MDKSDMQKNWIHVRLKKMTPDNH